MDLIESAQRVAYPLAPRPARVAHFISSLGIYGAERWIHALINHLDSTEVQSIVITIGTKAGATAFRDMLKENGVRTEHLAIPGKLNPAAMRALRSLLRRDSIDILHTHGFKADILGYLACRCCSVRIVSTPHGWSTAEGWRIRAYESVGRMFLRGFDCIYPLSPALYDGLVERGFAREKLKLILNGVDIAAFDACYGNRRVRQPHEPLRVLFAGRLCVAKGVSDLIRGFAAFSSIDARLRIVGEGPDRRTFELLSCKLGVADRVAFAGAVSSIVADLHWADVVVLPSYSEGIPRIVMEAFAAGVPVIGSDIPGMRTLIDPMQTGFVVPSANPAAITQALRDLAASPDAAQRMTVAARERIERHFSAQRMAADYAAEYKRIAAVRFRILFLTTVLPGERTMGSEVASQTMIDAMLNLGAQVVTLGYRRKGQSSAVATNEICIGERAIETRRAGLAPLWWFFIAILRGLPYSAAKYHSAAFVTRVRMLLARYAFDAVVVDHAQVGWLVDALPAQQPIVAAMHNIEHQMYGALARAPSRPPWYRWLYRREASLMEQLERRLTSRADEIWALTEDDAAFFSGFSLQRQVRVITLPGGTAASPPVLAKECDVALIGSWSWRANADALEWFLRQIYPNLPARIAIQVAGKGADWLAGRYPNIDYRGFVSDAQSFLAHARVVAIPTVSGGGIQIKTLDAIASGSRIVATPLALRGIANPPSTVHLTADPELFARELMAAVDAPAGNGAQAEIVSWIAARRQRLLTAVATGLHAAAQCGSRALAKVASGRAA